MTKNVKYNIIRVPRTTPYVDFPASFPPLGRLYLELLENKDKVKPELRDSEYIPKSPTLEEISIIPITHSRPEAAPHREDVPNEAGTDRDRPSSEPFSEEWGNKYRRAREEVEHKSDGRQERRGEVNHTRDRERHHAEGLNEEHGEDHRRDDKYKEHGEGRYREDREDRGGRDKERNHKERDDRDDRDDRHRDRGDRGDREDRDDRHRDRGDRGDRGDREDRDDRHGDRGDRGDREDRDDRHRDRGDRDDKDDRDDIDDRRRHHKDDRKGEGSDDYSRADFSESSDSEDDLSRRLKLLLADSDSEEEARRRRHHREERRGEERPNESHDETRHEDRSSAVRESKYSRQNGQAPTLAELEAAGHHRINKELPDITHSAASALEEEDRKRELLFKFELLKKSYKTSDVPAFSIHSDLPSMERTYEATLKGLSLDASVTDYKKYLVMAFMGIEFALGQFLHFDMEGFTQQQILSMNSYERLLLEMGEKSYVPGGSKFPVEVRLLFLVLMNSAFFIFGKMISRKTGFNPTNMLSKMASGSTASTKRKRPMRGPNINLDDIPETDQAGESPEA